MKEEGMFVIVADFTPEEYAYALTLARAYGYGDDVGRFAKDVALDRIRIMEGET
ncbi:MAG: hypothetical protein J0I21_08625 [Alphaproteobacteria bacterium]|nr:hypothetical protein [Alphaproteobacteria bacterium]